MAVARLAGIQAAKRTSELVPLCHPVSLTSVTVDLSRGGASVEVEASAETVWRTGVEMEALTACAIAALTVYDMCKSLDRSITIEGVALSEKSGGRSGHWRRDASYPQVFSRVERVAARLERANIPHFRDGGNYLLGERR